jgi:hypothetical protein
MWLNVKAIHRTYARNIKTICYIANCFIYRDIYRGYNIAQTLPGESVHVLSCRKFKVKKIL